MWVKRGACILLQNRDFVNHLKHLIIVMLELMKLLLKVPQVMKAHLHIMAQKASAYTAHPASKCAAVRQLIAGLGRLPQPFCALSDMNIAVTQV